MRLHCVDSCVLIKHFRTHKIIGLYNIDSGPDNVSLLKFFDGFQLKCVINMPDNW